MSDSFDWDDEASSVLPSASHASDPFGEELPQPTQLPPPAQQRPAPSTHWSDTAFTEDDASLLTSVDRRLFDKAARTRELTLNRLAAIQHDADATRRQQEVESHVILRLAKKLSRRCRALQETNAALHERQSALVAQNDVLNAEVVRQQKAMEHLTSQVVRLERCVADVKAESRTKTTHLKSDIQKLALEKRRLMEDKADLEFKVRRLAGEAAQAHARADLLERHNGGIDARTRQRQREADALRARSPAKLADAVEKRVEKSGEWEKSLRSSRET